MRLAGSSKHARVTGLGALLGDTLAQADLLMSQAQSASAAGDHASAYAKYKQAFNYYVAEEDAAEARAQGSGAAADWTAFHAITAKREKANEGMTKEADALAKSTNAYASMPQTTFIDTPEAMVSQSKLYKTLRMLNDPFPTPTAAPPPDELYFTDNKAYLRQALNTRNWDAVSKWYASQITEKLKTTQNASQYYALSQLNVQDYCDRVLDTADFAAFMRKCLVKYAIFDLGTYVGIGYGGDAYNGAPNFVSRCSLNSPAFQSGDPDVTRFQKFIDSSNLRGPDRFDGWNAAVMGRKYGCAVCWVQEPKFWTTHRILDTLAIVVGSAIVSYGIGAAFTAPAAAGGAAAAAGTAAAAGGVATGATVGTIITAGGIETVVVPGVAIGAATGAIAGAAIGGTVGAAISAGAIAPTTTAPAISAPSISAESIDTVVVSGTAIPAAGAGAATVGTVGGAISAGAVVATNAPPPLTTQQPPPEEIENITVEGERPVLPELNNLPLAGGITGGLEPLNVDALQPENVQIDDQSSMVDRIKGSLTNAIKSYGAQWVRDHLAELLRNQLGRNPTQQELDAWADWGSLPPESPNAHGVSTPVVLGVIGLVLAAALLATKKKRKGKRSQRR